MEERTVERSKEAAQRRDACVLEKTPVNRILTADLRHDTPRVHAGMLLGAGAAARHADTVELVLQRGVAMNR